MRSMQMYNRVYNFAAGPACLPEEALEEARDEMMNYRGYGMSVMEMSHRSTMYDDIHNEAISDFRKLVGVPDDYEVLFMQGGGSMQFAAVPMNLMKNRTADYIVTGNWANKALQEAKKFGDAAAIASSEDCSYSCIPDCTDLPVRDNADYVYICENNTIYGTEYFRLPDTKGKTLVADVSSCFLSRPIDVKKYGLFFGGVQKNIGPAGNVIVVVRKDLITDEPLPMTPTMLTYKTYADKNSLYNTPNCWGIYMCGKVFKWLLDIGGLEEINRRNEKKAGLLYSYLDQSRLFRGTVRREDRSLMNVTFVTGNRELDARFVKEAAENGLVNLKGHRIVGGMRASLYNAVPYEGVQKLVDFMEKFEKENINSVGAGQN
jgi:phosphoserine aminotransferase